MLKYIILLVFFLLCIILVGFFMKKKHYKNVDRLEEWKFNIMDRPVLDEMSKVKQLNMTGQTEQLFERWRHEWDEIVTVHLPDVEEYFIDAEDCIDKFRFKQALLAQAAIEEKLTGIEELIQKILTELNDLVGSEEKNRSKIEELKQVYRDIRKSLLARRHSFGSAANRLEIQLDDVIDLFYVFEEKTTNGNYLEAREIVLQINNTLEEISMKMKLIPGLLIECQTTIPSLLKELTEGYDEMKSDGYILTHIQIKKEVERFHNELATYLSHIEKTEIAEIEKGLNEIKEGIEVLFDLLEKEVHAKHYFLTNQHGTDSQFKEALEKNNELKVETETVQKSYHLADVDLEAYQQTEKKLNQLFKRFELLLIKVEQDQTAQTELSSELSEIKGKLDTILEEQRQFSEKLETLRQDEVSARKKVTEMRKEIKDITRLITRSNLPGLPQDYEYSLQDANESIRQVSASLEEKPLNMDIVQKHLEIALLTVEKLANVTDEMLEDVSFAESVIQYGNRYRSRYPKVSKKLDEAEIAFRSFQYKQALEQAATAIEEVEPGALKRVEKLINEQYAEDV